MQNGVVNALRSFGHFVYDFKNPPNGSGGFAWSHIDPNWKEWTTDQFKSALKHPVAIEGYKSDKSGMDWADVCILLMPCGRSAHSEAGVMKGAGKKVIVLFPGESEPELMYLLFDHIVDDMAQVITLLDKMAYVPRF